MTEKQDVLDYILIGIVAAILISLWAIWFVNNNRYLKEYQNRCQTIGWDICEQEYYATHTKNGLPK